MKQKISGFVFAFSLMLWLIPAGVQGATACSANVKGTTVYGNCIGSSGYSSATCGTGKANANVVTGSTCTSGAACCILRSTYDAAMAGSGSSTPSASSSSGILLPTGTGLSQISPMALLLSVLKFLLYMIGGIGVLSFIYAGYQYIFAAGDESKVKEAKNIIVYSVIGIAVALASLILVTLVTRLVSGTISLT